METSQLLESAGRSVTDLSLLIPHLSAALPKDRSTVSAGYTASTPASPVNVDVLSVMEMIKYWIPETDRAARASLGERSHPGPLVTDILAPLPATLRRCTLLPLVPDRWATWCLTLVQLRILVRTALGLIQPGRPIPGQCPQCRSLRMEIPGAEATLVPGKHGSTVAWEHRSIIRCVSCRTEYHMSQARMLVRA